MNKLSKYERLGHHEGIFGVAGSGQNAVMVDQIKNLLKYEDVRVVVVDSCGAGALSSEYYGLPVKKMEVSYDNSVQNTAFDEPLLFMIPSENDNNPCTSEMSNLLLHIASKNQEEGFKTAIFLEGCVIPDEFYSRTYLSFLSALSNFGGSATLMGNLDSCRDIKKIAKQIDFCVLLHQSPLDFEVLQSAFKVPKWHSKALRYAEPGCGMIWWRNQNAGTFSRIFGKDVCMDDFQMISVEALKNK